MINVTYRFFVSTQEQFNSEEAHRVAPVYGDSLALEWSKESGQQFYRAKLSGSLSFVGNDFDWIMSQSFDAVIYFTLQQSVNSPVEDKKIWRTVWRGTFMRTDATIDLDNKIFEVQPEAYDGYTEVLAGMDKEYDLMKLAPAVQPVKIDKRPLIQVYIPGENVVSCFLSQMWWEQDVVNAVTDVDALVNTYNFVQASRVATLSVSDSSGAPTTYNGDYTGSVNDGSGATIEYGTFYKYGTDYSIRYERTAAGCTYRLYDGETAVYGENVDDPIVDGYLMYFAPLAGGQGLLRVQVGITGVYARYLLDLPSLRGITCSAIPTNDIVENNRNYRYCLGYDLDLVEISGKFSDEPTEWGMNDDGKYFLPPGNGIGYYPVGRSQWADWSYWFRFYVMDWSLEQDARAPFTLRDNYDLASVIDVLLQQVAPGVRHYATTEYSQFLYSSVNPISGQSFRLSIAPKTNILNGEYQEPASTAKITLGNILEMLKNTYKCYWYVDNDRFIIEQIQWFRNGGSYTASPVVGYDLTKMTNARSGKAWDFQTRKYTFDKSEMPERYQFSWMDESTDFFDGEPIEVISKYVEAGNIEEVQVTKFTSDIDLMLLNPGVMSDEGFAVFAAIEDGEGGWRLPYVNFYDVNNVSHILQNGLLSFAMLQNDYWRYDMPAKQLRINGTQVTALSVQRGREQEVVIPVGGTTPDMMQVVKTSLGNGQIESFSLNLSSRMAEAKLRYDTQE